MTTRQAVVLSHTPHDAGITTAELEAEAHIWARERGLVDYDVVICDELPVVGQHLRVVGGAS